MRFPQTLIGHFFYFISSTWGFGAICLVMIISGIVMYYVTRSRTKKGKPFETTPDGKAKTAYAKDGINLRKGAGTDTEVITQIPLGRKLKIYPDTKKDGWIKATYKGKKGYVKLEYVTTKKSKVPSGTDESAPALPQGKEITLSDSVNVRVSMSETADKVGLAYQGDTVKVIQSYAEGWTKVEWKGQTGYIKTELIK